MIDIRKYENHPLTILTLLIIGILLSSFSPKENKGKLSTTEESKNASASGIIFFKEH
jgi:hypothetical protein